MQEGAQVLKNKQEKSGGFEEAAVFDAPGMKVGIIVTLMGPESNLMTIRSVIFRKFHS